MKNKKHRLNATLTPKESNVYSKLIYNTPYDSYGVEHRKEYLIFYKHAILSGLVGILNPKELNGYCMFSHPQFMKNYD